MFEEKHVDLKLTLPSAAPPVLGDADRLTQVVINLLANAQKFAPEDTGRVHVGLDIGAADVTISVADNGPGIPPEKQDEIFKEFRQVASADGERPPGTGLGLAICRRILDHLDGHIRVDSTPPEGTTFHITLPLCRSMPPGGTS